MAHISVQRTQELLSYDPETGALFWRVQRGKRKPGDIITCKNESGYILVRVDNILMRAHRVAWAIHNKEWPENELDHINGVRDDNRISNLRLANRCQNMKNIKKPTTNKSGFKGISWHKEAKKWQAHIKSDGKNYYLGLFEEIEDAHNEYVKASKKLHGIFANHG